LQRVEAIFGIVPPVYYSSYQLNYFRITAADEGGVRVEYDEIEKPDPDEETFLQRLLTRTPKQHVQLPPETVVDPPRERTGERLATDGSDSDVSD
jgi:hypothetical protein